MSERRSSGDFMSKKRLCDFKYKRKEGYEGRVVEVGRKLSYP